ncbi:hypothetical protein N7G274_009828 [Stereocaulon virgatum]|uniref:Ap4A phosphorylase 1/2 N-terminal domain-containing protein n=1 Tax=Stereocaulon virgatum TaxID=373712 RepID=A0ABR4A1Z6_9LECA
MHKMSATELGFIEDLPIVVKRKYNTAKAGKALFFSETRLAIIHTGEIPFQLRFCPALPKKPIDNRQQHLDSAPPPKPDLFKSPSDALLIARIPVHDPTHALILNKFPVIPQHFIVATIPYKAQTQLLEVEDLQVTYACLKAWEVKTSEHNVARRLFAFFNSGEHFGASQSHRHVYIALFPLLSETRM